MALFERLFSNKRKVGRRESRDHRSCQITSKQVRLLLFKECDWRGRKLLFDSSTIEKVPISKQNGKRPPNEFPCVVEVAEEFAYMYNGPAADASVLGEMIFGAVAMNCKGVSLKIHIMDEPKRLMCTKVFCVPTARRASRRKTEDSDVILRESSSPLGVPVHKEEVSLSFSIDRGDSGFYGEQTPRSSVGSTYDFSMLDVWDGSGLDDMFSFRTPSGRKLSTSSNGSWQRRTFRNLATRFELGNSSNLLSVPSATNGSDSQIYSNSSTSGTCDSLTSGSSAALRKNKLGLALLISVPDGADKEFVRRCVEMSPQLQSLVCRLRLATMAAGARAGGAFVATLHQAAADAAGWLSDLIEGPRLQPVWLQLAASPPARAHQLADTLLHDLCAVLAVGDTKTTNFFISTLLTHVLTYHLGWVTTVSPYDSAEPPAGAGAGAGARRPHNAAWAQLADLRGALGCPPRAARTVLSGTGDVSFLNRLLLVLTYFIRCGDVTRSDFEFDDSVLKESETVTLKRTATHAKECSVDVRNEESGAAPPVPSEVFRRSTTLADISQQLSSSVDYVEQCNSSQPGTLRRNPTVMLKSASDSSLDSSSSEAEVERKVVFVLGDDERLVGLKNKSNGGKSVKRSSRVQFEPVGLDAAVRAEENACTQEQSCEQKCSRSPESPSKCCAQTLQHSKPIKHSGFKFEFDKYPQIVTNYMKSKNLEILDRHYIGKPGNLKLDNFQFDPTIVPPIPEERCEACYKCQMMESVLQTPTNASELEYMNDVPRQSDPQYARECIVGEAESGPQVSPKTFVRRKQEATLVVNAQEPGVCAEGRRAQGASETARVRQVIEFSVPRMRRRAPRPRAGAGPGPALLAAVSDHYVPDFILQGTLEPPKKWEPELRRDLELAACERDAPAAPPVAILGDTDNWEVRVVGRAGGLGGSGGLGGMSALVAGMLDALPAMRRARVPHYQCLSYLEGKLREFCIMSKTLADMLMTTDFCDIATLTKSLNIDVNDVPLLLAIATTHTPQVASRYGISYR